MIFEVSQSAYAKEEWLCFPDLDAHCTSSLASWVEDALGLTDQYWSTAIFATSLDLERKKMASAMAGLSNALGGIESEIGTSSAKIRPPEYFQKIIDGPNKSVERFQRHGRLSHRNIVTGFIDLYLWYLADILKRVMKKRPDVLKSNEQVRVDEILDFGTKRELLEYLVERKVSSLSYGGIFGLEKYIKDTLGIDLFPNSDCRGVMKFFIELRNIYAHNRGIANSIFLERTRGTVSHRCVSGERIKIGIEELIVLSYFLRDAMCAFDIAVVKKFSLQRKKLRLHLSDADIALHREFEHVRSLPGKR